MSDAQGRDHVTHAELALDEDGKFLGLRVQHARQHGRLSLDLRAGVPTYLYAHAAGRRLHDAGDLLRGEGGLHQHRAGRCLSRRRAAGGDLRAGAPGRRGGARDWASTGSRSAGATSSRPMPSRTRRRSRSQYDSGDYDATLDKALKAAD